MRPPSASRRTIRAILALLTASLVATACAGPPPGPTAGADAAAAAGKGATPSSSARDAGPTRLTNCGVQVEVAEVPQRLVTLHQGATEVALALGLEDRMVGTASIDDAIAPRWRAAYESVPVLAKESPSAEAFLATRADFAYASYASAFAKDGVGERDLLKSRGIASYVSPFGCQKSGPPATATFDAVWGELRDIARVFDVEDRAESIIAAQRTAMTELRAQAPGKGLRVLWFDSGDRTPFVGAGDGGPQVILDTVGATNVFADLPGAWADGSWERVVAARPDVIVLADATWSTAQQKIDYLRGDPVLGTLPAVQREAFVILPFSETTPGVRLADGATSLAAQLRELNSR